MSVRRLISVYYALRVRREGNTFKSQSRGWLGGRVVSVLVTVLGKLFTPIVPLFTKQRNW